MAKQSKSVSYFAHVMAMIVMGAAAILIANTLSKGTYSTVPTDSSKAQIASLSLGGSSESGEIVKTTAVHSKPVVPPNTRQVKGLDNVWIGGQSDGVGYVEWLSSEDITTVVRFDLEEKAHAILLASLEKQMVEGAGLRYFEFNIDALKPGTERFRDQREQLLEIAWEGDCFGHCFGGNHRAPWFAAMLLRAKGYTWEETAILVGWEIDVDPKDQYSKYYLEVKNYGYTK